MMKTMTMIAMTMATTSLMMTIIVMMTTTTMVIMMTVMKMMTPGWWGGGGGGGGGGQGQGRGGMYCEMENMYRIQAWVGTYRSHISYISMMVILYTLVLVVVHDDDDDDDDDHHHHQHHHHHHHHHHRMTTTTWWIGGGEGGGTSLVHYCGIPNASTQEIPASYTNSLRSHPWIAYHVDIGRRVQQNVLDSCRYSVANMSPRFCKECHIRLKHEANECVG